MRAPFCVWWRVCPSCDGRGWDLVYRSPGLSWSVSDGQECADLREECMECSGHGGWIAEEVSR